MIKVIQASSLFLILLSLPSIVEAIEVIRGFKTYSHRQLIGTSQNLKEFLDIPGIIPKLFCRFCTRCVEGRDEVKKS